MRTVQVIHGIANPSAGPSYSVARLAHALAALGHESRVFSPGPPPATWDGGAELALFDGPLARRLGIPLRLVMACRRFAGGPGILHDHGIWRATNLFPLALPRPAAARVVCSPRGTFSAWSMANRAALKAPFWRLLQHPALRRVDLFHATSAGEAEDVRRLGFRQPIAVIPNGVDLPPPSVGVRLDEVLFVGRLAPEKGLDLLLPAWSELAARFPGWRLRIAGPLGGAYAARMQTLATGLRLPRCEFTGELRGGARTEALERARVFVLPSYTENFGLAIAEALAHGVPVVTTTGTPWTDLETRGAGWRTQPTAPALVEALAAAMATPAPLLAAMGAAGRAWIGRDYGWEAIAERMLGAYRWLLEGGARPGWVEICE